MTYEAIATLALATVVAGCGPEVDGEDGPPGVLEYEIPSARFYRLDRRVDIVGEDPAVDSSGCGFLTDRAYDDLVGTLEALDLEADYGWSECFEGFEHSPFECSWQCCRPELMRAALIYLFIESHFSYGKPLELDGEPYVAVEPGVPCPE